MAGGPAGGVHEDPAGGGSEDGQDLFHHDRFMKQSHTPLRGNPRGEVGPGRPCFARVDLEAGTLHSLWSLSGSADTAVRVVFRIAGLCLAGEVGFC